jgi:hypothetical protein
MGLQRNFLQTTNLVFVNQCLSRSAPSVIVWQDLRASEDTFFNFSWKLITGCGYGRRHPFPFPDLEVSFEDVFGNHTPRQSACSGDSFSFSQRQVQKLSVSELIAAGRIDFRNGSDSRCRATLWRGQSRIGYTRFLDPGEVSSCFAHARIRIGAIPEAQENTCLSKGVMERCATELSLQGIRSASLVMMGGGWGAKATAFSFHLLDIDKAGYSTGARRQSR